MTDVPRTPFTATVVTEHLDRLRSRMSDVEIAERVQLEIDGIVHRLSYQRLSKFWEYVQPRPNLRCWFDDVRDLWVSWVDVCQIADVRNTYLEGLTMRRERAFSSSTSRELTIVRADECIAWLRRRNVRKELALPLAAVLEQHAQVTKQQP